ncbi:MAG TPA: hypothetical protein VNW92_16415 [Polyangiaceae bacterium]|jgi:hypothetical protein|nr:hypothetical protein [Polyangiaceae bacterium]
MAQAGGEKPSWGITKVAATGTIWLRFVGPTRSEETPDFINALNEMMPDEDANVVFDLRELVGHNPDTKEPIKTWLRENKPRIATITVIVPKSGAILKMVTAVISLATGVKISIRDDIAESASVANL